MEDNTLIIWHNGQPAAINQSLASQFGLVRGQLITDATLFEQVIAANSSLQCSIDAQKAGQECLSCGS
jgi:hypothetical protein